MSRRLKLYGLAGIALVSCCYAQAPRPVELHQRLAVSPGGSVVALTLDACSGGFDRTLIDYLIAQRIPATVFATRKWLRRNRAGISLLLLHPELFQIENHGMDHRPAVIGKDRQVYGITGHRNTAGLIREVLGGAAEITQHLGVAPRWYRGATAVYDADAIKFIQGMGYGIAGFSVNADQGATLSSAAIEGRLARVVNGDIIIAHMNRPDSDTAQGLQRGLDALARRGFHWVKLGNASVRAVP